MAERRRCCAHNRNKVYLYYATVCRLWGYRTIFLMGCNELQVVASLLEEVSGESVYARRYCPGGYTWQQHLSDAKDPKRSLYRLLGEGGQKHWDYIVFQVSELPVTTCRYCDMLSSA